MNVNPGLKENITDESIAYGYTLAIWGTGALLLTNFSITEESILAFVLGGVLGFATLSLVAFKHFIEKVENPKPRKVIVVSMIHILASFGTVFLNYLFMNETSSLLSSGTIFFIAGFNVSVLYNIMLLLERYVSEDLYKIENGANSD